MNWETKPLNQLGYVSRGKSRHRPRNAEFLYGGEYPFIQTADVKDADLYIKQYSQTYSDEGLAQSKLWKKGTMCITIAANIADTAILDIDACFPDSIIGFVADEKLSNVKFVKYFFDTIQESMRQASQGATQDNLSVEKLLTFNIAAPPLKIQKKIASILSNYDDLIENNVSRIRLLEEAAQNLYIEWFEYFRFPNSDNTKSDIGLPKNWQKKRADEIFNINIGKTPPREQEEWFNVKESGNKWVSIRDINNSTIFISETNETLSEDAIRKFNINIAKTNTVILSFKLTVGKIAITTEDMVTNEAIAHFNIIDEEEINAEFIYFYLKRFPYDSLGNTSSIGNAINSKIVKSIPIILPEKSLIREFGNEVRGYFKLIKNLQQQNQKLKEARNILLPRLMNGEIKV